MNTYTPSQSFLRVATATPVVHIGNVTDNLKEHRMLFRIAHQNKVSLVVFPELSLTGYTIGDLVQSPTLLKQAEAGLFSLAAMTAHTNTAIIVGLPLMIGNGLYNCAALVSQGSIRGIVPKTNLPTYKEFYEKRWYQAWRGENSIIQLHNEAIPVGQLLFQIQHATIGIEICEDLWVADQPSITLAARGATVICNVSASPESVTKTRYRRDLVSTTAARLLAGYIYASADPSESTTDIVMSGHAMINEAGRMLAERQPFDDTAPRLTIADVDIDHLLADRRRDTNYENTPMQPIATGIIPRQRDLYSRLSSLPFVPNDDALLEEVFTIQAYGLKQRLIASSASRVVLGLSGGLDSTLAFLVALRTAELLGKSASETILTLTMPGLASSHRTQSNAEKLAQAFGIENRYIPIGALAKNQLQAIGHDGTTQNITYENTQARLRTALLFNTANQEAGIVLGTGDLSEIALGWSTFNGDHMSGYNVNASIPKTLVRHLVRYAAGKLDNQPAKKILSDILDTPISPELVSTEKKAISQKTEELIGPYELHDFFLYHFIRWQTPMPKILYLANQAFDGKYEQKEIEKWLHVFRKRFSANQWKRSVMPDGPKVGSVSLSPRGDWRMPSDAFEAEY